MLVLTLRIHNIIILGELMASCLQKFPSGNESRAEGENNEMGIQNYRERSRSNNLERYHVEALCC